jgi:hypothetical protein
MRDEVRPTSLQAKDAMTRSSRRDEQMLLRLVESSIPDVAGTRQEEKTFYTVARSYTSKNQRCVCCQRRPVRMIPVEAARGAWDTSTGGIRLEGTALRWCSCQEDRPVPIMRHYRMPLVARSRSLSQCPGAL